MRLVNSGPRRRAYRGRATRMKRGSAEIPRAAWRAYGPSEQAQVSRQGSHVVEGQQERCAVPTDDHPRDAALVGRQVRPCTCVQSEGTTEEVLQDVSVA